MSSVSAAKAMQIPVVSGLPNQPININDASSVSYWVDTLHCSERELRVAVADVGPLAGDVGNCLGKVL